MLDLEHLKMLVRRGDNTDWKFHPHPFDHNQCEVYSGATHIASFYKNANNAELACYLLEHLDEIVDRFSLGAPDCHSDVLSPDNVIMGHPETLAKLNEHLRHGQNKE